MKIKLIHIDGKMPNLALMKLAAWHKKKGDKVSFKISDPDIVYISSIFKWNKAKALGIGKMFDCLVSYGGYGINNAKILYEIEHIMPDYSLYSCDYSMGFTSRGCIRNCEFCIVPRMEGKIKDHAPITEFLSPGHKKLILFDNNFLASPKWKENLNFIIDNKLKINFTQGLDIRLINKENASMIAETKFFNRTFKYKQLHFAWDLLGYEDKVKKGIKILNDAGINSRNIMFYVLVGFNTTFEQDLYRFRVLREYNTDPFIMVYDNRKDRPILKKLARWVNRRIYKVDPDFKNYKRLKKSDWINERNKN